MTADDRLAEWFTWFKENVDRGRDPQKEKEFTHVALGGLLECILILRAQQRLREPDNEIMRSRLIYTP